MLRLQSFLVYLWCGAERERKRCVSVCADTCPAQNVHRKAQPLAAQRVSRAPRAPRHAPPGRAAVLLRRRQRRGLADEHVIAVDALPGNGQPVLVQLFVRPVAQREGALRVRALQLLAHQRALAALLVLVAAEEDAAEQAAVDAALVHDHAVLLVVPAVARQRHDGVDARGQLAEVQVLHRARGHQRLLRVKQNISERVHPQLVVGAVHAHRLCAGEVRERMPRQRECVSACMHAPHACSAFVPACPWRSGRCCADSGCGPGRG
jgi:hypothetical protein